MNFNHYFTNDELEEVLIGWAAEYPDLASLVTIGESYLKRPIRLLILTNRHPFGTVKQDICSHQNRVVK